MLKRGGPRKFGANQVKGKHFLAQQMLCRPSQRGTFLSSTKAVQTTFVKDLLFMEFEEGGAGPFTTEI